MAIECAHAFHPRITDLTCHSSDVPCSDISLGADYMDVSLNFIVCLFFSIVDKSPIIYLHEVHSQDVTLF